MRAWPFLFIFWSFIWRSFSTWGFWFSNGFGSCLLRVRFSPSFSSFSQTWMPFSLRSSFATYSAPSFSRRPVAVFSSGFGSFLALSSGSHSPGSPSRGPLFWSCSGCGSQFELWQRRLRWLLLALVACSLCSVEAALW
jgi:hypothetical protein